MHYATDRTALTAVVYSTATKSIKFLPVTVSLQVAAGHDAVLYDLIDRLVDAGLVSPDVLTGPNAFALAAA